MFYRFNDFTWIANRHRVCRDVFHHDASGPDNAVVTDFDSRQYRDSGANPYVVADSDWAGIFEPFVALYGIYGMSGCIKSAVGSDEHIVAECYRRLVKDYKIEVGVKIISYADVVSIITVERLLYEQTVFGAAKYFAQQPVAGLRLTWTQFVVIAA